MEYPAAGPLGDPAHPHRFARLQRFRYQQLPLRRVHYARPQHVPLRSQLEVEAMQVHRVRTLCGVDHAPVNGISHVVRQPLRMRPGPPVDGERLRRKVRVSQAVHARKEDGHYHDPLADPTLTRRVHDERPRQLAVLEHAVEQRGSRRAGPVVECACDICRETHPPCLSCLYHEAVHHCYPAFAQAVDHERPVQGVAHCDGHLRAQRDPDDGPGIQRRATCFAKRQHIRARPPRPQVTPLRAYNLEVHREPLPLQPPVSSLSFHVTSGRAAAESPVVPRPGVDGWRGYAATTATVVARAMRRRAAVRTARRTGRIRSSSGQVETSCRPPEPGMDRVRRSPGVDALRADRLARRQMVTGITA
jgi:hypothetical protein